MSYKFQLGQVLLSPGVKTTLTTSQLIAVLRRHVSGDWDSDRRANERALLIGSQVFSKFLTRGSKGQRLTVWVLTVESRTKTFVMFPCESAYRASDLDTNTYKLTDSVGRQECQDAPMSHVWFAWSEKRHPGAIDGLLY